MNSNSITSFNSALASLTPLEVLGLQSAFNSSEGNGHDFGYTDDIEIEGKSKKAVGGVISSLLKKGILTRDDEFGQFCFGVVWDDCRHEAAELVEAFLKGIVASINDNHKAARAARRKARRAARKAAAALLA